MSDIQTFIKWCDIFLNMNDDTLLNTHDSNFSFTSLKHNSLDTSLTIENIMFALGMCISDYNDYSIVKNNGGVESIALNRFYNINSATNKLAYRILKSKEMSREDLIEIYKIFFWKYVDSRIEQYMTINGDIRFTSQLLNISDLESLCYDIRTLLQESFPHAYSSEIEKLITSGFSLLPSEHFKQEIYDLVKELTDEFVDKLDEAVKKKCKMAHENFLEKFTDEELRYTYTKRYFCTLLQDVNMILPLNLKEFKIDKEIQVVKIFAKEFIDNPTKMVKEEIETVLHTIEVMKIGTRNYGNESDFFGVIHLTLNYIEFRVTQTKCSEKTINNLKKLMNMVAERLKFESFAFANTFFTADNLAHTGSRTQVTPRLKDRSTKETVFWKDFPLATSKRYGEFAYKSYSIETRDIFIESIANQWNHAPLVKQRRALEMVNQLAKKQYKVRWICDAEKHVGFYYEENQKFFYNMLFENGFMFKKSVKEILFTNMLD
jgi:hypothetical protein